MKTKHIILLGIFALCVTLFSSCINEHVTGVTLDKNELFLSIGDTERLTATIEPADADNPKVKWKSSHPDIATVDDNGLVTAINDGETTITVTAKDGKKTDYCSVCVDYRGKWVGSYECNGETVIVDVEKRADYLLYLSERGLGEYKHGLKHYVYVYSDGSFQRIAGEHESIIPEISGNFYKDSIYILYIYPSPGYTVQLSYKGKKSKSK